MQHISTALTTTQIQEAITNSNLNPSPVDCWRCWGVGTIRIPVDGIIAVKNCLCVRRKLAKNQLKAIPPIFNSPKISQLKPRPDLHSSQAKAVALVKANPDDSFLFTGKNGTGKTHLAWALYRHAVSKRRPLVACTVRELLAEFRKMETGEMEEGEMPRVTSGQLKRSPLNRSDGSPVRPWFLFFDEFEKARPSEFAAEQLFNVLDAARSFKHQVVITSNFTARQLRDHWGRIDAVWGNSIMTRLESCHQVEMF